MWTFKQLRGRRVPFDATLGGYIRDGIGGPPKKVKHTGPPPRRELDKTKTDQRPEIRKMSDGCHKSRKKSVKNGLFLLKENEIDLLFFRQ